MSKIVIGNFKANILTLPERELYLSSLEKSLSGKKLDETEIVLCLPFVHLEYFAKSIKNKKVKIGAQNIFWEEKGAFTGEVTPQMIKNIGVQYVIIGHTERRGYFGETNKTSNLKIKSSLKNNLFPIYCIGESKEEREDGLTKKILTKQILEGLEFLAGNKLEKIIIAYDPIWAVGTDVLPTSDEMMGVRILIKKILAEKYGLKMAEKIKILYGGSVKAKNVRQVCVEPGMDGVLVGRESLIPMELVKIAEIINNA